MKRARVFDVHTCRNYNCMVFKSDINCELLDNIVIQDWSVCGVNYYDKIVRLESFGCQIVGWSEKIN